MGMEKSLMWLTRKLYPQARPGINRGEHSNSKRNTRNGSCVVLENLGFSHVTPPVNCFTVNFTWQRWLKTGVTTHVLNERPVCHPWLTTFLQGTNSLRQQFEGLTALHTPGGWIKTKTMTQYLSWDCFSPKSLLAFYSRSTPTPDT